MPVIVLVGSASKFTEQLISHFSSKFEVSLLTDEFKSIRSFLAHQEESKLYLIPNLLKPERYEIFCLCRKNEQKFISLVDSNNDESCASDKQILRMGEFNSELVEEQLIHSKVAPTTANRRSKGTSLKSIGDLKNVIKEANKKYLELGDVSFILQECEKRVMNMWKVVANSSTEEAEECYRKIVESELKSKGFRLK